ncbi:MAG: glycosyltransferase family 4 protein [Aggregatilineales bacterium]
MTHVLMISMDATLLTGAIGDSRVRHAGYARRAGRLDIVVCARGVFEPFEAGELRIRSTESRSRLAYVIDGYRVGRKFAVDHPPDVITTQDPFLTGVIGLRLRRTLHVPLIVQDVTSVIDNRAFAQESVLGRVLQLLARQVVRRADAVRVLNNGERAACIRLGVRPDRVHVLPIPTDLARFVQPDTRIDWRARLGIAPANPVALWVGRPVPVKNLPLLLAAFAQVVERLPNAQLVLAGDTTGTLIPGLIGQLHLEKAVKLAGRVIHADLPSLYQAANVYVHSSSYEGFGVVMIEASAAGLPVISTTTDGARDIIREGETGLLVPLNDNSPELLANALRALLSDPARAKAMGERARADVLSRYDPARMMAEWVGLWHSVAAKR